MMASMFSAGAALLLAASASAQTAVPAPSVADQLRIVRTAASVAAHQDAAAYLETERRRERMVLASSDVRPVRRTVGYELAMASR
jgi:hypothetical protein